MFNLSLLQYISNKSQLINIFNIVSELFRNYFSH